MNKISKDELMNKKQIIIRSVRMGWIVSLVLVFLLGTAPLKPAKAQINKKHYKEAMNNIDKGAYNLALRMLYNMLEKDKDNANLNYYVGLCYYKTASDKDVAIPYLKKASQNVTRAYKNKSTTKKAPIFANYYLGLAYQNLGKYEQAIEQYNFFKRLINPKNKKLKQWISETDLQIVYCKNEQVKSRALAAREKEQQERLVDTVFVMREGDDSYEDSNLLDSIHFLHDQMQLYKKQYQMIQDEMEDMMLADGKQPVRVTPRKQQAKSGPDYSNYAGMFTIQVGAGHNLNMDYFNRLPSVKKCLGADGLYRYVIGEFESYDQASQYRNEVVSMGYTGAWVAPADKDRTGCQ